MYRRASTGPAEPLAAAEQRRLPIEYHYRRRHQSGLTAVNSLLGGFLLRSGDNELFVADACWTGVHFTSPAVGRRGRQSISIARPAAAGLRFWLRRTRPLRLLQLCDEAGASTLQRVDFATPVWSSGNRF